MSVDRLNTPGDTPRTDAARFSVRDDSGWPEHKNKRMEVVPLETARELEREVASYRRTANELAVRVAKAESDLDRAVRDRDARAREACTFEGRQGCSFVPSEIEAREGYPPDWVRVDLMVSPAGEMHAIGGKRADGDPLADLPFIGLERIKEAAHVKYNEKNFVEAFRREYVAVDDNGNLKHNGTEQIALAAYRAFRDTASAEPRVAAKQVQDGPTPRNGSGNPPASNASSGGPDAAPDDKPKRLLADLEFIACELESPANGLKGCAATVREAAALLSATPRVPYGWRLMPTGYMPLFNALAASVSIGPNEQVGISVEKFLKAIPEYVSHSVKP
jgi:hypothetical protein